MIMIQELFIADTFPTQNTSKNKQPLRLPWRVLVLGSATTRALPKKFEAVFNSEVLRQSV
jgi:hypothetical protein